MAFDGLGPAVDRTAGDHWFVSAPTLVPAGDTARPTALRVFAPAAQAEFAELDCVRDVLPAGLLAAAERRAAEIGVGADRVLLAAGVIDEDAYVRWLARSLDIGEEPLDERSRDACPLDDDQLVRAAAAGLLPLRNGERLTWVIAPRGTAARTLTELVTRYPHLAPRIRLTSTTRLNGYIARQGADAWEHHAAEMLRDSLPHLSASAKRPRTMLTWLLVAIVTLGALAAAPDQTVLGINALLSIGFVGWLGLRLLGSWGERPLPRSARICDDRLPVYTIVAALYREAGSVESLVASLVALDYPALGSK